MPTVEDELAVSPGPQHQALPLSAAQSSMTISTTVPRCLVSQDQSDSAAGIIRQMGSGLERSSLGVPGKSQRCFGRSPRTGSWQGSNP